MQKQPNNSVQNNKSNQIIAAGIPSSGSTMMYQVLVALFPWNGWIAQAYV